MRQHLLVLLLSVFFLSCDDSVDTTGVADEIKSRKIRKVKEAEILEEALLQGKEMEAQSREALFGTLRKILKEKSFPEAVEFCNQKAYPLIDSVEKAYGASIRRVSLKNRNPANAPDSTERQLLEAYQYNQENSLGMQSSVQMHGREYVLYTSPIIIGDALCLNCHGQPGKELRTETLKAINALYPDDKAVNYNTGDLRGMWSIRFKKQKLVRDMSLK